MSSLGAVDRDLDAIVVDADRLSAVRAAERPRLALAEVDGELQALSSGVKLERARPDTEPPPVVERAAPRSEDVPIAAEVAPQEPLALELDSGETGLDEPDDLPREPTQAGVLAPIEPEAAPAPPPARPPSIAPSLALDDPNADLASLLGDSDPMREDEGAAPLSMGEIEPEATVMFTAEDAARYSRPAPPLEEGLDGAEEESVELDFDDAMIELEEEDAPAAAAPRTAPPPPPPAASGSRPPPAPGFLGKILQRKP